MDLKEKALAMHKEWNGKLETIAKSKVNSREDLAIAYTPGVAEPCKVIAEDKEAAYTYTMKANTVAVISDGSAVLGLGNIGPYAAMPVMEGKCVLFKEFGDVNAVPICLDTQDTEEIIATIKNIAPAFGGINLEEISAPRCFEIEERLKAMLDIPVFHDDQHGTAIVVLAGIINGLRVTDEETMEIAEMVLNKVNKSLVTMVEELGVKAVGVSGKDGGLLQVEKKYSDGQDIGYVGEITGVNPDILFDMLEKDYLPIIAPIGLDKDYHTYNINADDAACAIAKAVHAEKLAFLTDIEGLYKDINDKSTFISRLTASEAEGLIHDGYIGGGMLPKLNNCTSAIRNGVNRVHILDGRLAHCLLLEIFTNQGIGTAIVSDEE